MAVTDGEARFSQKGSRGELLVRRRIAAWISKMLFLSDEDFNNRIVRGLLRRLARPNLVRAQDGGLAGKRATKVLE